MTFLHRVLRLCHCSFQELIRFTSSVFVLTHLLNWLLFFAGGSFQHLVRPSIGKQPQRALCSLPGLREERQRRLGQFRHLEPVPHR